MKHSTIVLGVIGWAIFSGFRLADGWDSIDWVVILLLMAPFIWVPLTMFWLPAIPPLVRTWHLPAAAFFGLAYAIPDHALSPWLVVPWVVCAGLWALAGLKTLLQTKNTDDLLLHLAPGAMTVGAIWTVIDRSGIQPLGFDPVIILLTAVHFHYMGFLLLVNFWKRFSESSSTFAVAASWILLAGIAMTATGITLSQMGVGPVPEVIGVTLTVFPAMWLAWQYISLGLNTERGMSRWSWIIGGMCLMGGMVLAMLYGLRFWVPISFLTIPFMYMLHGTLNVLGVGTLFTLGWYFSKG
jgi:hypothetical protein